MKKITGILFIILYLNALIVPVFPIFNYMINTDVYTALCINTDKPEIECEGKCQMMSEISENEHLPFDSEFSIEMKDMPIGYVHFFIEQINWTFSARKPFLNSSIEYSFKLNNSIDHPPQLLS